MLTVLTQNLRIDVASDGRNDWTHRRPLMEKLLSSYEADVIAFQEVFENQRRDLVAMLPGYAWHGRGREPDETGDNFQANARIKAIAAANASGLPAFADSTTCILTTSEKSRAASRPRWCGPTWP